MERTYVSGDNDSVESNSEDSGAAEAVELRATVELETQAKIDSEAIAAVDGMGELDHPYGMTLEAQEKWEAREAEKQRTRERRKTQSAVREAGNRVCVAHGSMQRRQRFRERAASVEPAFEKEDAREALSCAELAAVNQQAARIAEGVRESGTRAAISRRLADEVCEGRSVLSASIRVLEAEQRRAGTVVPIGELEAVSRREVSIEGRVEQLWNPNHTAIAQVGLIADETSRVKVTVWKASDAPWMDEGERVRIRGAAKNWYNGRVSLAVTGDTSVHFPERGRWWDR
ncbi:SOSS complex subunit B family protein [Halobaculum lipolyticum]|uniref:SOSS complex subunit B family protein n=1 Tax=Halobaculum lipolyticum TaxID=3032001 RepID=A0ABD5WBN5_9EURY|nr:SOSS complex subunit B family protein [Halobaculum sp. DT31]